MHKQAFFVLTIAALALAGCGEETASSSASISSASSSAIGTRMSVETLLSKFKTHYGTNYLTFSLLGTNNKNTGSTSAAPTSDTPTLFTYYREAGFYFDYDEKSGWDASLTDGGIVNVPLGAKDAPAGGVYHFTLTKTALGSTMIKLGDAFSGISDAYYYATPAYLADNASSLASLFVSSSSTINTLSDATELPKVAKALGVYGPLMKALPDFVLDHVEVDYTAGSTAFPFRFYGYLNAADAAEKSRSKCYLAATASLRNFAGATTDDFAILTAYPKAVSAIKVDPVSVVSGQKVSVTAYLWGSLYDHIRWSIDDLTGDIKQIATLSSETTSDNLVEVTAADISSITGTSLASKLHATVYSDATESDATKLCTIAVTLTVKKGA